MEPPSRESSSPPLIEERIIQRFVRHAPSMAEAGLGIGDDGALVGEACWSTDLLVEGVHFTREADPSDVGFKAVAVSVSDVAAMGARPRWLLLGLSVPGDDAWLRRFTDGVATACRCFGVALVGGDTTRSPSHRTVSSTVGGTLVGAPLLRSGGRPGDDLWVSGPLGAAGAGWSRPIHPPPEELRRPRPPIELALTLARERLATAALDLSDGLAVDLARLARASGCGAQVWESAIPRPEGITLREATGGGEDYALLVAAGPERRASLEALGMHRIGVLTEDPAVLLLPGPWPPPLYRHFQRGEPA